MKKIVTLLLIVFLIALNALAASLYDSLPTLKASAIDSFITQELTNFYQLNENQQATVIDQWILATQNSPRQGDEFALYRMLADTALGAHLPDAYKSDKNLKNQALKLQKKVLSFLIEQMEKEKSEISVREYLISQISRIAGNEQSLSFDLNEKAFKALSTMSDSENRVLAHTALIGLKPLIFKSDKKWKDLAEDAAEKLVEDLSSKDTERQRIYFVECLDVIKKAQEATPEVSLIWKKVTSSLADIKSPELKKTVVADFKVFLTRLSGTTFKKQMADAKTALGKITIESTMAKGALSELLSLVSKESDPEDLEPILNALLNESKKDRTQATVIYSKILAVTSSDECPAYKLRLLNNTLVELAYQVNSILQFQQTAAVFLGEISLFQTDAKASVSVASLGNLLASSEEEGLVLPVLNEMAGYLESDLPIWLKRRLVTLIFIQAGDSPREKTALRSAELLVRIAENGRDLVVRWEAATRIQYLAKFAQDDQVRLYAANWK